MEKTKCIVITKKEEKALKLLNRLFLIKNIDFDALSKKVEDIVSENEILKEKVAVLSKEKDNLKEELKKYISEQLERIAVNVRNETQKSAQLIGKDLFKGNHINEQY
jgi:hypothetical protein